jgi:hypothetical protein
MEGSPFLPLSEGLSIEQVRESADRLLVHVISVLARVCCPLCGAAAHRIHSRYSRRVGCHTESSENTPSHVAIRRPLPLEG